MAIIKNEIPILEFDSDKEAVIRPNHEKLGIHLPEKAVFAFLSEYVDEYAKANNAKLVSHFLSSTKSYPIYVVSYKGEEITLVQAPVGAPAAAQIMDWLIGYGVKKIISTGCCGALTDIPENTFLIPYRALRDEGTSYHYMPPSRFIDINKEALIAIEKALNSHKLKYDEIITWSTDGFFRETKEKVEYRKAEGCTTVEMECSALAAVAKLRNAIWGEILFTGDTLSNTEEYDERDWGKASSKFALELALDSVCLL